MNCVERNLVLGRVGFNACTKEELINMIENLNTDKKGAYVSFLGAPHVAIAETNETAAAAYAGATIVAMDGSPVARAAKQCGIVCERCGGPDIMNEILRRSEKQGRTQYFYGENPEVLKKMVARCQELYPDLRIVGYYAPPYRELSEEEDEEIVRMIGEQKPDYLWISLGSPKQDCWMAKHAAYFPGTTMMGVGAAFKFLSGAVRRAPQFWQKLGLEWLYRLLQEPHLMWQRYLKYAPTFYRIKKKTLKEYKAQSKIRRETESAE